MLKLAVLSLFIFSAAYADEPVCQKCQVIREHNAAHPENNYYWYDDYLKDQKKEKDGSSIEKAKLSCSKCGDPEHKVVCGCGCGKKKKKNYNNV